MNNFRQPSANDRMGLYKRSDTLAPYTEASITKPNGQQTLKKEKEKKKKKTAAGVEKDNEKSKNKKDVVASIVNNVGDILEINKNIVVVAVISDATANVNEKSETRESLMNNNVAKILQSAAETINKGVTETNKSNSDKEVNGDYVIVGSSVNNQIIKLQIFENYVDDSGTCESFGQNNDVRLMENRAKTRDRGTGKKFSLYIIGPNGDITINRELKDNHVVPGGIVNNQNVNLQMLKKVVDEKNETYKSVGHNNNGRMMKNTKKVTETAKPNDLNDVNDCFGVPYWGSFNQINDATMVKNGAIPKNRATVNNIRYGIKENSESNAIASIGRGMKDFRIVASSSTVNNNKFPMMVDEKTFKYIRSSNSIQTMENASTEKRFRKHLLLGKFMLNNVPTKERNINISKEKEKPYVFTATNISSPRNFCFSIKEKKAEPNATALIYRDSKDSRNVASTPVANNNQDNKFPMVIDEKTCKYIWSNNSALTMENASNLRTNHHNIFDNKIHVYENRKIHISKEKEKPYVFTATKNGLDNNLDIGGHKVKSFDHNNIAGIVSDEDEDNVSADRDKLLPVREKHATEELLNICQSKQNSYSEYIEFDDKHRIIQNTFPFDCKICFNDFEAYKGVILRDCSHCFCIECIRHLINSSESVVVECPHVDDDNKKCKGQIEEHEILGILPPNEMEIYKDRVFRLNFLSIEGFVQCCKLDCKGFSIVEKDENKFVCNICCTVNCVGCKATHEGLTCCEYKESIDENVKLSNKYLMERKVDGLAMDCPSCGAVVEKIDGCDGMQCTICKKELCWATKGLRWGPNGKGDTSGGCRCTPQRRCHPSCIHCH